MHLRTGNFSLADNVFEPHEDALVRYFIAYLSKKYQLEVAGNEFRFKQIGAGLSGNAKFVATASDIFPYFVKIGEVKKINREHSFHNKAISKIPPLSIAPLETLINPDQGRAGTRETTGFALIAFRYVSGQKKTHEPRTFFEVLPKLDVYQSVKFVDDLFQSTLYEMHGFHDDPVMKPFEHFQHTEEYFQTSNDDTLVQLVKKYNNIVQTLSNLDRTPVLPHGFVHGDLHCQNIILGQSLSPIIIDFEMVRPEGCLLHDFAEFEIGALLSLLEGGTDDVSDTVRLIYKSSSIFSFFGIDQTSRTIRAIRSNLGHSLFNVCGVDRNLQSIDSIDLIYKVLLMRFLCSYGLIAQKTLPNKRKLFIVGVFERVFDDLFSLVRSSVA